MLFDCLLTLQYEVISWGNTSAKYLRKSKFNKFKIITHAPFLNTKVDLINKHVDIQIKNNIFNLEMQKFVLILKQKQYLNASVIIFKQLSWLERRASDRKFAGSMPVLGITSLSPWERHLTLIS